MSSNEYFSRSNAGMWIKKLSKIIWFFSLLVTTFSVAYVYAFFGDSIQTGVSGLVLTKEIFFYTTLAYILIVNTWPIVKQVRQLRSIFYTWFLWFIILSNLFFIIILFFLFILNREDSYDYSRLTFMFYTAGLLLLTWLAAGLILFVQKLFLQNQNS